jgi:uncharacterized protein
MNPAPSNTPDIAAALRADASDAFASPEPFHPPSAVTGDGAGAPVSGHGEAGELPASQPVWGLGQVVGGLIGFVVGQLVGVTCALAVLMVAGTADMPAVSSGSLMTDASMLPVTCAALAGGWAGFIGVPWYVSRRKMTGSFAADFGLRSTFGDVGRGLGYAFVCLVAGALIQFVYSAATGTDAPTNTGLVSDNSSVVVLVVLWAFVAVGTPIAEELFFRGLFLQALVKRCSRTAAVVVSSLVFGLMHAQSGSGAALLFVPAVTGVFGAVLGVATLRHGRLGPAIWAHIAINTFAVIVAAT